MAIFTAIGAYLTATLGATLAGIVGNIAVGIALIGAQQLLGSVFGTGRSQPKTSTPQAQATINQAAGNRIRGYGRAKLGGTRAFFDSRGGTLSQIVMAHHGKIDGFEQFFVGDRAVSIDVNGWVTTSPLGFVQIKAHDGDPNQLAEPNMYGAWPDVWTSEHRLRGIAYWLASFVSPPPEDFQTVFPDGYNTPVTCVCRLSRVYDPRTGAVLWSDNAALCMLDYLTHPDGFRRSINDVDVQSFADFADVCGEPIALASGGSEPRYRIWGVYGLNDEPQDVLYKMRAACDAELYQTAEGKIGVRGGAWQAPTVTIRDQDILGHSMEQGNSRFSAFNHLKIFYTSKDHDFQTVEAPAWENLEDQGDRGVLSSDLNLDMVPSASQARRLAKIHIAKSNPRWKGTIVANLSALNALGERTVRIVLSELDIDDAFFVAGFIIRPDLTAVEISVMSISQESYTWAAAEEGQSTPIPQDTRPDLSFPIPENLVLGLVGGVITANVSDPGREDLELQAEIRAGAGSLWQPMQINGRSATFAPIKPSTTYQVQARWRGPQSTAGAWTSPLAEITTPA